MEPELDTGVQEVVTETTEATETKTEPVKERSLNDRIADIVKSKMSGKKDEEVAPLISDAQEDSEPEPKEKEPVKKPEVEKKEVIKAPNGWSKEEKLEFEKLSESAKRAVLRTEGEKESLIGHKSREIEKLSKTLEKSKEAIEAHDYIAKTAKAAGAPSVQDFVQRIVEMQELSVKDPVGFLSKFTDQNPMGFIKALMSKYDIDVRQLAAGREDLAFDNENHKSSVRMRELERENQEYKEFVRQQQLQQQQQQAQQQEQGVLNEISSAMESFYSKKDEQERDAATPYIQHAVRVVIAEATERGEQIGSYYELISRAHNKALRLNENYSPAKPQTADYARSRTSSLPSRAGSSTGVPREVPQGNFNDVVATIVRNNAKRFL
jgi:hypothetical protein